MGRPGVEQMSGLIGRSNELQVFRDVLSGVLPHRILAVSGLAGVGKSTLLGAFQSICVEGGVPHGLINARSTAERAVRYPSVVETLAALERGLSSTGCRTTNLHKRLNQYFQIHGRVVEKVGGPERLASVGVQAGRAIFRAVSALHPILQPIDELLPDELPDHVAKAIRGYLNARDFELFSRPAEGLTKALLDDLSAHLARRRASRVVLFFDEYERILDTIDSWLRRLSDGGYGPFDRRVLLVLAGRLSLGQDWIARGHRHGPDELRELLLSPFTVQEVALYLEDRLGIASERAALVARQFGEMWRLPLVTRLLAVRPERLKDQLEAGEWATFQGTLAKELVNRLFDEATPAQREAALAVSVAQSFNLQVIEVVLADRDLANAREHFDWLEGQHFVNPNAPPYSFFDLIREAFLTRLRTIDASRLRQLHLRLRDHYTALAVPGEGGAAGAGLPEAPLEATYHHVSGTTADPLMTALKDLLHWLPESYQLTVQWSRMLQQVATERPLSGQQRDDLERLAKLLDTSRSLSNAIEPDREQQPVDPAMDVFFTTLYRIEPPKISAADARLWLRYFECRRQMTSGGDHAVEQAKTELLDLWPRGQAVALQPGASKLLVFCVATDLGEACTRLGLIAEAVAWNKQALKAARQDKAPLREALARYQLSTNQKRQSHYQEALANADRAIRLLRRHAPSSHYHLGRFLLDKANTLTYLNRRQDATEVFEESRRYLKDVSPLSYAEASHRLGWLLRVRGQLDEALARHQEAIDSFETIEAELLQRGTIETSALPFLKAKALHSMGNVLSELDRHGKALASYWKAIEIFHRFDNHRHEAIARKDRAWSCFKRHGLDVARGDLETALRWLAEPGQPEDKSTTHPIEGWLTLSRMHLVCGQREAAKTAYEQACSELPPAGVDDPYLTERVRLHGTLLAVLAGDNRDVEERLGQAEAYANAEEPPLWSLLTQATMIRALRADRANDADGAHARLTAARTEAARWNRVLPMEVSEFWDALHDAGKAGQTRVDEQSPQPAEEMIDVFDPEGNWLGRETNRKAHADGLWHRSFHCWIAYRRDDGVKVVVLQRRGPYKRDYPNYLDISAAGHYQAGEDVEGGIRELEEELGVSVDAKQLRLVARRTINEQLDNGTVNREFQDIYFLLETVRPRACKPSYPEVGGVFQAPIQALRELLDEEAQTVDCKGRAFAIDTEKLEPATLTATVDHFIPASRTYLKVILRELDRHVDLADGHGEAPTTDAVVLDDGSQWQPLWSTGGAAP